MAIDFAFAGADICAHFGGGNLLTATLVGFTTTCSSASKDRGAQARCACRSFTVRRLEGHRYGRHSIKIGYILSRGQRVGKITVETPRHLTRDQVEKRLPLGTSAAYEVPRLDAAFKAADLAPLAGASGNRKERGSAGSLAWHQPPTEIWIDGAAKRRSSTRAGIACRYCRPASISG